MKVGKLCLGASRGWKSLSATAVFCVVIVHSLQAQTLTTLASFDNSNGAFPTAVVQGVDGKLYGTAANGGTNGFGTVFVATSAGALTNLHNFSTSDGSDPTELVLAANGTFYGLATFSYGGSVFTITPGGKFTLLATFNATPDFNNSMLQSAGGNFYGTTFGGGSSGWGSVFKMTPTGAFTTLYSFDCYGLLSCPNQAGPSGLAQSADGSFYGTNTGGNSASDVGTVFRITPNGTLTTLYTFCVEGPPCTDGNSPDGLMQAADGDFYGATIVGGIAGSPCLPNGPGGCGTIYKITPSGNLTTLYVFCTQGSPCPDGGLPLGPLVQGTDGNFYGTTTVSSGAACASPGPCGTIFRLTPSGGLTTLHVFTFNDGSAPRWLVQATDGNFYGVTTAGGAYGWGTVFRLSTGLGPFVKFMEPAGKLGQTVGIFGQGFTGATNVSFNGIPASFTVVSSTLINAKIPPGATTGFVTVQIRSRTVRSNVVFRVL